jgi:hypothetical protein
MSDPDSYRRFRFRSVKSLLSCLFPVDTFVSVIVSSTPQWVSRLVGTSEPRVRDIWIVLDLTASAICDDLPFFSWYNWTIILPAELAASAVLVNYWVDSAKINNAVWITICMAVVFLINFLVSRRAKPSQNASY